MRDDLGEQRVVVGARCVARVAKPVHPDAGSGRGLVGGEHATARPRQAVLRHGLEIDARLHRHALRSDDGCLLEAEVAKRRAGGDVQLNGHQVEPRYGLGDGMFHLQARVGLHENEAAVRAPVHQELDGADSPVGRGRRDSRGGGEHRFPHGR